MESIEKAQAAARAAWDAKASDVVILHMEPVTSIASYFVICTGNSVSHLRAVRDQIVERLLEQHGVKSLGSTRFPESQWIAVDYGDLMIHVFTQEKRDFYSLEDNWSDAPRVDMARIEG